MLRSPFPVYCCRPFLFEEHSKDTCALKEHSKSSWALMALEQPSTKALGHLKVTWALKHSRHLGSWSLKHLRHSATRRTLGYSGTRALGHLKTRGTLFSRLFLYKSNCTLTFIVRLLLASSKSPQKKWSFSLMISSVDVTKSLMKSFIFVQWISTLTVIYNFVGVEIRRQHAS